MGERETEREAMRLRGHLVRYPEDLRDIRRLQQRLGLRADVVARILAEILPGTLADRGRPPRTGLH